MVEDYLSDREQEEALRTWWKENWRWIAGGVVLGLGLLGGWTYWKDHTTRRAHDAGQLYVDFRGALERNEAEEVKRLYGELSSEHDSSPYTQQSRLLLAKKHVDEGKIDEALPLLRSVIDTTSDDELAWIARLRVARLLIQQGKHDEALGLLNVESAGAFAAQVREVRGDAQVAKGNPEAARAEYAAALAANTEEPGERMVDRTLVELKLQDVGGQQDVGKGGESRTSADLGLQE